MQYRISGKNEGGDNLIYVSSYNSEDYTITIAHRSVTSVLKLYDDDEMYSFLNEFEDNLVMDITYLEIPVWAPILRVLINNDVDFTIDYFMPSIYDSIPSNSILVKSSDIEEISTKIEPLSGFTQLLQASEEFIFVPLLGFEGARTQYMFNTIEPKPELTFPVISIPDRRIEYYKYSLIRNRIVLNNNSIWKKIHNIMVNDSKGTALLLKRLANENPRCVVKIGLAGPRLQCLGAIVCSILDQERFQLIYDFPRPIGSPHSRSRVKKTVNVKELVDAIR